MRRSASGVGSGPRRTRAALVLVLCGAPFVSGDAGAQVGAHNTVPTRGPAVQDRSVRLAEDPVLVEVERIRRDLADFAKRYRKAKDAERETLSRSVSPALEEIRARVLALGGP